MEFFWYLEPLRELGFVASFVPRVEEVVGSYDKEEALAELEGFHRKAVEGLGFQWSQLWTAEQVHGAAVAVIKERQCREEGAIPGVDGLMTNDVSALLGIYTADCGLIWVADRRTRAVSLLHSGRKGTEGGILTKAVAEMAEQYGTVAEDLVVVLGPCIRPPNYEVDIASLIAKQARDAGVKDFYDSGICTGAEVSNYYSYRMEKGLTGRMLGLLASTNTIASIEL